MAVSTPALPGAPDAERATDEREQKVTNLELFFDLVFVFALTQVTALMADEPTWTGLATGLLILTALWQAWVAYAWLTNAIDPEEDLVRLLVFGAMAAMLIAALAVPGALGGTDVTFAVAYLVVRALHIFLYVQRTDDPGVHRAVKRLAGPLLATPVLLLAATALDGEAQRWAWLAIVGFDVAGVFAAGTEGWIVSPGHFAERHGLIMIIALGESIVAIGVGAEGELDAGVIVAAVLGVIVAAGIWWSYFDVVALVAERRLSTLRGAERARMARDSYSYLHLPMVAGIILLALGLKKVLGDPGDPLKVVPAVALCGGTALYFLGQIAFRLRNTHTWRVRRVLVVAVLLALIPLATEIASLATLALVAATIIAILAYEAFRFRDARTGVHAAAKAHQPV